MTLICIICKKEYTNKSSFDKHQLLCSFRCKTERERKIEQEELGDMPTYEELVNIVQHFMLKCNNLEQKVNEMQQWVSRKKRNTNVLEILKTLRKPNITFSEWYENEISVLPSHYLYLLEEHTIYQTLQLIIEHIFPIANITEYPIQCFSVHSQVFYVVALSKDETKDETNNEFQWRKMEYIELVYLFKKIQNILLIEQNTWRQTNTHLIDEGGTLCKNYYNSVKEIFEMTFYEDSSSFKRMKNILFKHLKQF